MKEEIRQLIAKSHPYFWYALAIVLIGVDQLSKLLALDGLVIDQFRHRVVDVLPFLTMRLACNTGAAFSMLQDQNAWLAGVGLVLSTYFAYVLFKLRDGRLLEGTAYTLILAGALGNFIDRLTHGCVVDFIHVHYGSFNFPIFNVADSAITLGVMTWILSLALDWRRERNAGRDE